MLLIQIFYTLPVRPVMYYCTSLYSTYSIIHTLLSFLHMLITFQNIFTIKYLYPAFQQFID